MGRDRTKEVCATKIQEEIDQPSLVRDDIKRHREVEIHLGGSRIKLLLNVLSNTECHNGRRRRARQAARCVES